MNEERQVITFDGHLVQGDGGPLEVPEGQQVRVTQDGGLVAGDLQIGKLKIVQFEDPQLLERLGESLWVAPEGVVPEQLENFRVQGGMMERSNVNMISEMTNMIRTCRVYEAFTRSIETYKKVDSRTASGI